jgi:adenine-specific DNA-methyltransferase
MQNLLDDLMFLFRKDDRFISGGKLHKSELIKFVNDLDSSVMKTLLSHAGIRKYFFKQVDEIFIFDKIKFQKFLSNKAFLENSYTAFKNKIGLAAGDEYLSADKNVVLAWPYKDCVLQGGQTKEDRRRNEIFLNEALAPSEIDRLLHPKAFTGFLKYSMKGNEFPDEINSLNNFIIRGNNLLVLYSLLPVFAGKIKLIYIDPPYNTGSDSFLYNDSFGHSTWLTFMKNRLEVAWKLLSPDGCIFIQIDDTEFAYLKVLCDEIFGRENFKENIVLKSSTESGVNAINVKRGERLFKVKEHILFYSKSPSFRFKPFYTKTNYNFNYRYEVVKKKGKYHITDLRKHFLEKYGSAKNNKESFLEKKMQQEFVAYALKNPENIYSLEKNIKKAGAKFKAFATANKNKKIVEEYLNSSNHISLVYDGGVLVPLKERIVNENGANYFGVLASDLWLDIGTTPSNEGGVSFGNGKKPEKLLKRIIEMATDEKDIVLDYHLGSGSTAAVAHKLNRRYIGIEQLDYGENDAVVRLQNVINGDQTGISKGISWNGGGSFIYFELKKCNELFVEKINDAKTNKQLKIILDDILKSSFLHYTVDISALKENEKGWINFNLQQKKDLLKSLLDLNFLYLPYSEIEDKDYSIPAKEIQLNQQFYSLKIR